MRNVIRTALVMALVFAASCTQAGTGTGTMAVGELTKQEAAALVNSLIKENSGINYEIASVGPSPIEGLWEIGLKIESDLIILYTDKDGKKAILPAEGLQVFMIDAGSGRIHTMESLGALGRVDPATIPLDNAITYGEESAQHKIVVFDDPL